MERTRQKKIGAIIQKDLTLIFQKLLKNSSFNSTIISVTKVRVSTDLSSAKIYLSVFPFKSFQNVFDLVLDKKKEVRSSLGLLVKNQIRRVPELFFYIDDSLEHIDNITSALKNTEDPIKDRSLLTKRNKL